MIMDIISTLPDAWLCYILSFLSTKQSVATSILSKRWKLIWRSVPALDFAQPFFRDMNTMINLRFIQSVSAFMFSRDMHQSLPRFSLKCVSHICDTSIVNAWISAAVQCRVEHLNIFFLHDAMNLRTTHFICKTLVVLRLTNIRVHALSAVDLPLLKILYFWCVEFSQRRVLAEFLAGTPNLEDLETNYLTFCSYETLGKFKRLNKLRRAHVVENGFPLDVLYNVQFLRIHFTMDCEPIEEDPIPEFHNLTQIEFLYLRYTSYWFHVLEVLNHCPKLESLSIKKMFFTHVPKPRLEDWQCPPCVPKCISMHLTSCFLKYRGSIGEFKFAKYIMQNARVLQDMTICTLACEDEQEELKMIDDLSLCTRLSSTCVLNFQILNNKNGVLVSTCKLIG